MKVCSIGSGSKGNGTLVQSGDSCILVDCGFGVKDSLQRLSFQNTSPEQLSALLITHEHGDHARGVAMLARKADIPVYLTSGTYQALIEKNWIDGNLDIQIINPDHQFTIGDLQVEPVTVPHDARQACQFIFRDSHSCFGLLTDVGSITPHIVNRYQHCNSIFLEFNHDFEMLMRGSYPESVKQRISGDYGHLSNHQAMELLDAIGADKLDRLVVSHVSEQNNSIERVTAMLRKRFYDKPENWIIIASQEQGCQWMDIS
jgi:phosphoribosyl 1,2-cyclic phosphodiesterase